MTVVSVARAALSLLIAALAVHAVTAVMGSARGRPAPAMAFADWVARLAGGDAGNSLRTGQPVLAIVMDRFALTAQLVVVALACAAALAWLTRRTGDQGGMATRAALCIAAVPTFLLAIAMIGLFAFRLHWLPATVMFDGFDSLADRLAALALPVATLTLGLWASMHLADCWSPTGTLRGLARLSLTALPMTLASVLVVETAFAVPGLGRAVVRAVAFRDAPVVEGLLVVMVLVLWLGRLPALLAPAAAIKSPPLDSMNPVSPRDRVIALWMPCGWLGAVTALVVLAPVLPLPVPDLTDLQSPHVRPGLAHLLGTDGLGRDLASRLAHGASATLAPTAIAMATAVTLGLALAGIGRSCRAPGRVGAGACADAVSFLPALPMALAVVGAFGYSPFVLGITVGVALAPACMEAVQQSGGRLSARAAIIRATALAGADAIAVVATLGAFRFASGVGIVGWGTQVGEAQEHLDYAPHQLLVPAVALVVTGLALRTIGTRLPDLRGSSMARPISTAVPAALESSRGP